MTRKRSWASVLKDGEEEQDIQDVLNKGFDDDDDFVVDPKISRRLCEKKSKVKMSKLKPSRSTVDENPSQILETSVQEFSTPSTSPMVMLKTCSGDFDPMTKPDSDINSNKYTEGPKSISTPEQTSLGEEEKFSTPVSTPSEGSCDKLGQRGVVSDLVSSGKSPASVSPNAGLVQMIPDKTLPPSLEAHSGVTISQPVSIHPPPVSSPQTTPSRITSGRGKHIIRGHLHNPGQANNASRGPRPTIIRPGAPRMMRPGAPKMMRPGAPRTMRPRVANPLRPRPRATPLSVNARSLAPARHSSMANPQPASSRYIPPVVELEDLSPDMPDQNLEPELSGQMTPSLPSSSVVSKLSFLGVSLAQVHTAAASNKHVGVLPPGISVTRIPPSREEGPSLSLPGLADALLHLGSEQGRRRMVQYDLTEGQVKALSDLGVKEVARIN